jgi:hypothetical protein
MRKDREADFTGTKPRQTDHMSRLHLRRSVSQGESPTINLTTIRKKRLFRAKINVY